MNELPFGYPDPHPPLEFILLVLSIAGVLALAIACVRRVRRGR